MDSRALPTLQTVQEDLSGEDSDEWKPEDHPPPSDDEDDEMDVDTSEKEEAEEDENEEEEDDDKEEEGEEEDDEEDEEEQEATVEKKETGQDGQEKGNEGGTSKAYFIRTFSDANIPVRCSDES